MSDKELAEKVCELLNQAYQLDPIAMKLWGCHFVHVNQSIVDHPTIIVKDMPVKHCMSNLGLLNGIVDKISGYRIAEKWSDTKDEFGRYEFLGYIVVEKK